MAEATYPTSTETRTNRETINKESIKKGFDDFKKFASTNFSRARQYVTEKAGKAQTVTEYDPEFATLSKQLDQIKLVTEKMLTHVQSIVQPNPNARLEDWARTKFDRPKPQRTNEHALFSADLAKASEDFGTETQYGAYLSRCSEVEGNLAESRRRFEEKVMSDVITPLKAFMEIDVKGVMRDKRLLAVKRLDLDAHKSAANKAGDEKVQAAEATLRNVQADFDAQLEKVRKSMRKIVDTHVNHMGYLKAFMSAQKAYFAECQLHLGDIDGGTNSYTSFSSIGASGKTKEEVPPAKLEVDGVELDREDSRKARMLYDYDADNESELTVNSGELITVTPIPDDDDYILAEWNGQSGKVPSSYIEYL